MIPQTQRWWRGPVFDADGRETDEGGDCFAACIASILEVPIDGFPNFLADGDYEGHWCHRWQQWLYENYRAELRFWSGRSEMPDTSDLCWWIAGVDINGTKHSVVFYKDEFRHDPAPEGCRREWTLADVEDAAALFSIASIWGREDGPFRATHDAKGNPIPDEVLA